jgi:hypothetical protein
MEKPENLNATSKIDAEPKLTLKIEHTAPVSVLDLTQCLAGFSDEHKRFVEKQRGISAGEGVQLYLREVKTGSIIADLVALTPFALPFMEHSVTILDFSVYLKGAYDFLLGKIQHKPKLQKPNYENLIKILEPVAKDRQGKIIIDSCFRNHTPVNIQINYIEANAAQNSAHREIAELKTPATGVQEKVLLYWYQARNDQRSQTGDRAIIESISDAPVKTIFISEGTKGKMLLGSNNPFKRAFVVDVMVETIDGKPALYRITDVHDSIPKPQIAGTTTKTPKLLRTSKKKLKSTD